MTEVSFEGSVDGHDGGFVEMTGDDLRDACLVLAESGDGGPAVGVSSGYVSKRGVAVIGLLVPSEQADGLAPHPKLLDDILEVFHEGSGSDWCRHSSRPVE